MGEKKRQGLAMANILLPYLDDALYMAFFIHSQQPRFPTPNYPLAPTCSVAVSVQPAAAPECTE